MGEDEKEEEETPTRIQRNYNIDLRNLKVPSSDDDSSVSSVSSQESMDTDKKIKLMLKKEKQ